MSGFPNATNTGVPAGVTLTPYYGDLVINTPGAVIEGLDIHGQVTINASNVTLKNCKVTDSGYWVVRVMPDASGVIVQDCEINGTGTNNDGQHGILGVGTFLRNNIYNCENGITIGGNASTLIQDNYIHDLKASGAPHFDGVQLDGGNSNVTIRHNTIIVGTDAVSAVMINNYFGPISNIIVDNNQLVGGQYTVYSDGSLNRYSITGVQLTNNDMRKGNYGYWLVRNNAQSPVFFGNVDDVTGNLISGQQVSDPSGGTTDPVDTTAPTVSGVVASPSTATLTTGNTVTLKVNFSEAVTVSSGGQPTLTLNNGGAANYVSGSGSTALTFSYVVAAGQNTADLAVTRLNLNGATIRDAAGNNAVLSGAATNPAGTLAINTTPTPVDTTAPTVSGVVASPSTATLTTGNTVTLKVNFSEAVTVSSGGQPTLTLNNGGAANYVSGSGSTALTFSYVVAAGQNTADLAVTRLNLNGATIRDAARNNAVLSGAATNPAGTLAINTTPTPVDTTAPLLTRISPTDNSTDVARDSNLVLTFSEPAVPGSGNIVIHNRSDGTTKNIAITDTSQVTFSGNQVTINPSSDLAADSRYYVTIASGVIRDAAGNDYAGISNRWTFNFTTDAPVDPQPPADTTPPLLTSVSPTDNSTDVSRYSNLVLTFSETAVPGSGDILIYNSDDNTIAERIPVADSDQVTFSGDTVTIDPSSALKSGSSYYVTVDPGAIRDVAGNDYAGISDRWSLNFTTADGSRHHRSFSSVTEANATNSDNTGASLPSDSTQAASIALLAQSTASFVRPADQSGGAIVQDPQSTTSTETLTQPHNGHHGWHP